MLVLIGQLYEVERQAKEEKRDAAAIQALRQECSRPILEQMVRMVVLGRKNWLFAGHDTGGHRAAIIYSLVASCKLCKIDPFAYLQDTLDRVNTHPASQIADLLPANWTPSSK